MHITQWTNHMKWRKRKVKSIRRATRTTATKTPRETTSDLFSVIFFFLLGFFIFTPTSYTRWNGNLTAKTQNQHSEFGSCSRVSRTVPQANMHLVFQNDVYHLYCRNWIFGYGFLCAKQYEFGLSACHKSFSDISMLFMSFQFLNIFQKKSFKMVIGLLK